MVIKPLVIIGAGNFGREVLALINRINSVKSDEFIDVIGFVDDNPNVQGTVIDGKPVLGNIDWINKNNEEFFVTCSIGTGRVRKKVVDKIVHKKRNFLTLIDPSVIFLNDCHIEDGAIICANNVISINTKIGVNSIINLSCTVGHDTVIGDYCTINPGANISGCVNVGNCCDLGTGSKIIQGLKIVDNIVVGAGAVVVKSLDKEGTYVGVPATMINKRK